MDNEEELAKRMIRIWADCVRRENENRGRSKNVTNTMEKKEMDEEMSLDAPIDQTYPKVKPLTQAMLAAAQEQGATVKEFRIACARVERMIDRRASTILLSELESD